MGRLITIVAATTLCLTLTSCSDDHLGSDAASSDVTTTTAASDTLTTVATVPDPTAEVAPQLAACADLAETLSSMAMAATGAPMSDDTTAKIASIRSGLPDDIRADLDTLIAAYTQLSTAGDRSAEVAASIDRPAFQAASDRLSEYFQQTCGD